MNKDVKLLIFDFDGTLANTIPHIVNCILRCIEKFNLKRLSREDVLKYNGAVLADVLKGLGATDEQLPEIKKYYTDIFMEDITDIYLYDNVKSTLLKLKENGYRITLASNRGRNTIIPLLLYLGIENLFEKIICESDVLHKKPAPDMVEEILRETGCTKEEALIIGDTQFDIIMGKNAESRTCLVSYEEEVNENTLALKPDMVIHNLSELTQGLSNHV